MSIVPHTTTPAAIGKSPERPSICLVAHFAYGAMTGGRSGHIGGVERQTSLTARWLAAEGYPVSLVTWNDGGETPEETIDGVRVIKMCRRDQGLRGLRFFHPRWTSLLGALARADADIYYHNCAEYVTGQVGWWCRQHGKRFVYSVANDPDVEAALPDLKTRRERVLYRLGLKSADCIIVQTRSQQRRLHEDFGHDSVVIPMPCPGPSTWEYMPPDPPAGADRPALWIGRICRQKRPDRLLAVARRAPDIHFDVVGPAGDDAYAQDFVSQACDLSNITVHGSVQRERVADLYRAAGALICTSDYEGFPNTFLEAWSHGLPVVSRFDPDDLIAKCRLGAVADDAGGLAEQLAKLLGDPLAWREASRNGRNYYESNHTVETVLPRFEQAFTTGAVV